MQCIEKAIMNLTLQSSNMYKVGDHIQAFNLVWSFSFDCTAMKIEEIMEERVIVVE